MGLRHCVNFLHARADSSPTRHPYLPPLTSRCPVCASPYPASRADPSAFANAPGSPPMPLELPILQQSDALPQEPPVLCAAAFGPGRRGGARLVILAPALRLRP